MSRAEYRCRMDSINEMLADITKQIDVRMMLLRFVVFILICSDVFVNRVLARFNGAVEMRNPTNYGIVLQGIALVLVYLLIDIIAAQ